MDYKKSLTEYFHLLKSTKAFWVLAGLSILGSLVWQITLVTKSNPILSCLALVVGIGASLISLLSISGIILIVHQSFTPEQIKFKDTWLKAKGKILPLIGLLILCFPFSLISTLYSINIIYRPLPSVIAWVLDFIGSNFFKAFFVFGISGIVINNIKAWAAAWTSTLITFNNLIRVFLITGTFYLLRFLIVLFIASLLIAASFVKGFSISQIFDYVSFQKIITIPALWIFSRSAELLLTPMEIVFLTKGYLQFTSEVSYPALVSKKETA